MATLHDTALGADTNNASTLSTADTLTVTTGDLVVAALKWEGANGATVTFDTGAATPTFTAANAAEFHAANGDLSGASAYWTATSSGSVTVRSVLSGNRPFRVLKVYAVTPAGGTSLALDAVTSAQQNATTSPSW